MLNGALWDFIAVIAAFLSVAMAVIMVAGPRLRAALANLPRNFRTRPLSGLVPLVLACGLIFYAGAKNSDSGKVDPEDDNCQVAWSFNETSGSLVITTTVATVSGEVPDYESADKVPWVEYTNEIKSITIGGNGSGSITNLGNYAFANTVIGSVVIPAEVMRIGAATFANCTNLTSVTIRSNATEIAGDAFTGVGTEDKPCRLSLPDDWADDDWPPEQGGLWRGGYFIVEYVKLAFPWHPDLDFSYTYNGAEQSIGSSGKGYSISGNSATDAGTYFLSYELTNKHLYRWQDLSVTNLVYQWTIAPVDVEFTSESGEFTYDGLAHSNAIVTVSGDGRYLFPAEEFIFDGFATITHKGECDNTFSWKTRVGVNANNMRLKINCGKLIMHPATPTIVTLPIVAEAEYGTKFDTGRSEICIQLSGGEAQLNGKRVDGNFEWDPALKGVAPAVADTGKKYAAVFKATGSDYAEVSTNVPIVITKAKPSVVANTDGLVYTYGEPLKTHTPTGSVAPSMPGKYEWDDPSRVPEVNEKNFSGKFWPDAPWSDNYTNGTFNVEVKVNPAPLFIKELPTASPITYGQCVSNSTLSVGVVTNSAGSVISGAFAWDKLVADKVPHVPGGKKYKVTFKPESKNYEPISGEVSVEVEQAKLTVTPNEGQWAVYGSEFTIEYATNPEKLLGGAVITGALVIAEQTVGAHEILRGTLGVKHDQDYQDYTISFVSGVTFTITEQTIAVPQAVAGLVYDGNEQTGVVAAAGYTVIGNTATNAGVYTATATLTDPVNTQWVGGYAGETNIIWSIAKASLTATASSHTLAYGAAAPTYAVSYSGWKKGEETPTTAPSLTSAYTSTTAAGATCSVTFAVLPEFANYAVTPVAGQVTVERAKTAVAPTVATGLVYAGVAQNGYASAGAHVTLVGTPSATAAGDNYEFTAMPETNYAWSDGTTDAKTYQYSIKKAPLTVKAEAATVKLHQSAPEFKVGYTGFVASESAANLSGTLAFDCSYVAASASVGQTFDIMPKGLSSSNYDIEFVAAKLKVIEADKISFYVEPAKEHSQVVVQSNRVEVAMTDDGVFTCNQGDTLVATYTITDADWKFVEGAVAEFTLTVDGGRAPAPAVEAIDYTISFASSLGTAPAAIKYSASSNFPVKLPTMTLDGYWFDGWTNDVSLVATNLFDRPAKFGNVEFFAKWRKLVAVPKAVSLTYDGTEQTGVAADEGYTVEGGRATNAGEYTATAKLKDGYQWKNATGDQKIPWSIAAKAITPTVTLSKTSATYGDSGWNTLPTVTVTVDSKTFASGTDYTATWSPALLSGAGSYAVTVTLKGNYSGSNTATYMVNKRALTVTGLSATNRAYDGTTDIALTGGTLSGVVSGDEGAVSATMPTSGTVADANAGNGKAVTFETIALSGTKAGNYTLTQPTVTVNITQATVMVPTPVTGLTYSGSEQTGVNNIPDTTYATASGTATATAAGNYSVTYTLTSTTNYRWADNTTAAKKVDWSIAKAGGKFPGSGITPEAIDRETILEAFAEYGATNVLYALSEKGPWSAEIPKVRTPGEVVIYYCVQMPNYEDYIASMVVTVGEVQGSVFGFVTNAVSVVEGNDVVVAIMGGDTNLSSSVQLAVLYETAAAADLDLKGVKVNGEEDKTFKFPYTLTWGAGVVTNQVIRIPVKKDSDEVAETLTLVLQAPMNGVIGEPLCRVTIGGKPVGDKCYVRAVPNDATYGKVTGSALVIPGKKVTVKATANKGYVFTEWTTNGVFASNVASYSFEPTADVDLVACFEPLAADFLELEDFLPSNVVVGVAYSNTLYSAIPPYEEVQSGSLPTISVSGLPSGLKFTAKDIMKKGSKTEVEIPANTIYGTPTKQSAIDKKSGNPTPSKVKVTVKNLGGYKIVRTYGLVVSAAGTESGGLAPVIGDDKPYATVSVALSDDAAGKVTGAGIYQQGKKVTMKATANKGYVFAAWIGENGVTNSTAASYVINPMPSNNVTLVAKFALPDEIKDPSGKNQWGVAVVRNNDFAGNVTGAGYYAAGKKVTLKATANKGYVFAGWATEDFTVTNQAASLVIDKMPTANVRCYAKFVTAGEDQGSIVTDANGMKLSVTAKDVPCISTNVMCGVDLRWPVAASALSLPKVSVSGLPSGLKFTAKDIMKKGSKTEVDIPANTIYGAPTAASKSGKPSAVKVTVTTSGKSKVEYQIALAVDALPAYAVGTFDGPVFGADGTTNGVVKLTVAKNGKISGTIQTNCLGAAAKKLTLSAASFAEYDLATGDFKLVPTYKDGKDTVELPLRLSAADAVVEEKEVGVIDGESLFAYQNVLKGTAATAFDAPKLDAYTNLALTVQKDGVLKVAGKVPDNSGKPILVSGTSQVYWDADEEGYRAVIYLPSKKGFDGVVEIIEVQQAGK